MSLLIQLDHVGADEQAIMVAIAQAKAYDDALAAVVLNQRFTPLSVPKTTVEITIRDAKLRVTAKSNAKVAYETLLEALMRFAPKTPAEEADGLTVEV